MMLSVAMGCAVYFFTACTTDGDDSSTLDISGELAADVTAHEIKTFEEKPEEFCKGQIRREQFSEYDWQCEAVMGLGKCIVIHENPTPERSTFYCSLCGLKGDQMVCYMIQQD